MNKMSKNRDGSKLNNLNVNVIIWISNRDSVKRWKVMLIILYWVEKDDTANVNGLQQFNAVID